MEEGRPSRTAERAALIRAAHQLLDAPSILDDPLALKLIGAAPAAALRADAAVHQRDGLRRLRASVVLRSRFAEDSLADAVERGARQYVILGAGLDSFAYRNPFRAAALRVFEVDHPATQAWKRARLRDAAIAVPDSLTFVPVDFERQTLADAFGAGGFDPRERTFVSWLGVTVYLTREAVMRTLEWAASLGAGSEIVFGYAVPPSLLDPVARAGISRLAERAANAGEPWITFFEPDALARDLAGMGFAQVEDLGPAEAFARYFHGRADGLRPGGAGHLVRATLPG